MTVSNGLMGAVKRLANTMLGIVQTRLELLASDIEEEKVRIEIRLFYASICLLFFWLFMATLTIFITVLFWDSYRLHILAGFTTLYLVVGIWALQQFRRASNAEPGLFSASLNELHTDREQLLTPPQ